MPRIRYLKPDFFKDEDLTEHPHWVRLLFAGLWTLADREGRLDDRVKKIKGEIFPYENIDVEKGLDILSQNKSTKRPFIIRYKIEEEGYIQILQWHKHQKPHPTEKDSEIPPYTPLDTKNGEYNGEYNIKGHKRGYELCNREVTVKNLLIEKFPYFSDKDFKSTYQDFLQMRKGLRRPATDRAQELILKKLHEYDLPVAIKMLEQSIINSWQGIFPLKVSIEGRTIKSFGKVEVPKREEMDEEGRKKIRELIEGIGKK